MRVSMIALALVGLAACTTTIPDSGAGVGFDNSIEAHRAREAALAGSALPPPAAVSSEVLSPAAGVPSTPPPASSSQDAILEASSSLDASSANSGVAPVQASPSNPAPVALNNPGLSDENDFQAVSNRQSIESDAQRIAQNRSQYQVIEPTALPSRSGASGGPNIVAYALQTSHPRGTRLYNRTGLNLAARSQRSCRGYASPDRAQIDFLAKGGPQRDRMTLDPDGDGYACSWDPQPFRAARQAAPAAAGSLVQN